MNVHLLLERLSPGWSSLHASPDPICFMRYSAQANARQVISYMDVCSVQDAAMQQELQSTMRSCSALACALLVLWQYFIVSK